MRFRAVEVTVAEEADIRLSLVRYSLEIFTLVFRLHNSHDV